MGVSHAHLGPTWYFSEPSDIPYSPNQFLGWDFFCHFLQQTGSSWFLATETTQHDGMGMNYFYYILFCFMNNRESHFSILLLYWAIVFYEKSIAGSVFQFFPYLKPGLTPDLVWQICTTFLSWPKFFLVKR